MGRAKIERIAVIQNPNPKTQTPKKLQAPKFQNAGGCLSAFGFWNLEFVWSLEFGVWFLIFALFALSSSFSIAAETNDYRATVIVLVGAPGEEEFGKVFHDAAASWQKAAAAAHAKFIQIGGANAMSTNDLQKFRDTLARESSNTVDELWIAMVGHGTHDGRETKFNLHGPDLSANELSNLLATVRRPIAIIPGTASSAPFIKSLSATNRVIVTATRSGSEENFTRFGRYFAQSIADAEADLDKDGQTSLLEAFLIASRRVAEFYKSEGRLATEHALIDDNGDGMGTPSEWFRGIRATKKAQNDAPLDGTRAHQWHLVRSTQDQKLTPEQRKKRDELEIAVVKLRDRKSTMAEEEYYRQLEALLTKLGEIELSTESTASKSSSAPERN
jgi:hypothetical protein